MIIAMFVKKPSFFLLSLSKTNVYKWKNVCYNRSKSQNFCVNFIDTHNNKSVVTKLSFIKTCKKAYLYISTTQAIKS